MTELFLIVIGTVLVNNFVLINFLGLCPLMGASRQLSTAIGMGLATTFVLTLASVASYAFNLWVLEPLGLQYLRLISFILIIAGLVQFTELYIRKSSPLLHSVLGIFLPLITTNCAVLGVALLSIRENESLLEASLYGFGASAGFTLVLVLFSAMRERLDTADVPVPFRGTAIAMISAGLMSLAFMGFSGMV
jgi:electron transport complex protein RnfA